jgi:hypothetical protein
MINDIVYNWIDNSIRDFFSLYLDSSDEDGLSLGTRLGASDGILDPQSSTPSSLKIQSNLPSMPSSRPAFLPFLLFLFLPFLFLPFLLAVGRGVR